MAFFDFLPWVRRRRARLAEVRQVAREDLIALAGDVRDLDLRVEMPAADPRAKEDYLAALDAYERAERGYEAARRAEDLAPVSAALEEGRWRMECAKARLEDRAPPERRPPCFFDPRHGPSVRDVTWAPPGGRAREVPVCAADATRIEEGEEPAAREVVVAGARRPYYQAPPYYGGYAGGFFGGFGGGGFLGGLFLGEMLGGALGGYGYGPEAMAWGDGGDGFGDGDGDGIGDGGDMGGDLGGGFGGDPGGDFGGDPGGGFGDFGDFGGLGS